MNFFLFSSNFILNFFKYDLVLVRPIENKVKKNKDFWTQKKKIDNFARSLIQIKFFSDFLFVEFFISFFEKQISNIHKLLKSEVFSYK